MSRIDKVNEEIRHHVSTIVQRELDDPTIGFITITHVEVSPDLKVAHVYYTTLAEDELLESTVSGLERSSSLIRNILGKKIRMKFTPEIRFMNENMLNQKNRIDEILDRLHREEK